MSPDRVAVSKIWPPTRTLGEAWVVIVTGNWAGMAGENSEVFSAVVAVAVAVTKGWARGTFGAENDAGPLVTVTVIEPRYVWPSAPGPVGLP
jgi:hypothetical protein